MIGGKGARAGGTQLQFLWSCLKLLNYFSSYSLPSPIPETVLVLLSYYFGVVILSKSKELKKKIF